MSELDTDRIKQIVEAAILAADEPLDRDDLLLLFDEADRPERDTLSRVLETLGEDYAERGVELREVASGFRFQVRRELGPWVSRLWQEKAPRYSRAVLETLALIAYRQPITRGEIEDVRGVTVSTQIIRTLQERHWVRVVGHRDVPGRPAMYATTRDFLDYFGLKSLDELPPLAEVRDLDRVNEELEFEGEAPQASADVADDEDAGDGDETPAAVDEAAEEGLVSFVSADDEPEVDEDTLMDMEQVDAVLADFEARFRKGPDPEEASAASEAAQTSAGEEVPAQQNAGAGTAAEDVAEDAADDAADNAGDTDRDE